MDLWIHFLLPNVKKIFSSLVEYEDRQASKRLNGLMFPELKGTVFDLIQAMTCLYEIHPVVKNLIIFFYMTKCKCCEVKKFFELSLREYMGFFLEEKIINVIFEWECTDRLSIFIFGGLVVLNEAANFGRKYLICYFYKCHFRNESLMKEYSETKSVFDLADYKNRPTVNICAGNACGIQLLESKITCVDLNKYNGMDLLVNMDICNFIQCNIKDAVFESVASTFNVWVAIHACKELSKRIIEVFVKHASESSELYLVPCCTLRKKHYAKLLEDFIHDRIYEFYRATKHKKDTLRHHCVPAMHMEWLCSLCKMHKFKIKTLRDMKSAKNKIITNNIKK